jgi:hypothetical protein
MNDGITRVEALEQIRDWMEVVAQTAVMSASRFGVRLEDVESHLPRLYAESILGGITTACALGGRELTTGEADRILGETMHLYTEMMSDGLMQACIEGDATYPLEEVE